MNAFLQDMRHGLRLLVRNPAFTVVSALTLALGIGGSTAIFSLVNSVLLRPLPYDHSERIVVLYETDKTGGRMGLSRQDYEDLKRDNGSMEAAAAYVGGQSDLVVGTESERVSGAAVTPEFFSVFGVQPVAGRIFKAADLSDTSTIVISERLWKSRFGGTPNVMGQTVKVLGTPRVIIGVLPASFDFPGSAQVWVPLDLNTDDSDRSAHNYRVVARLKAGLTLETATAEIGAAAKRLEEAYPRTNVGISATLVPIREVLSRNVRSSLLLLFALVGLVLLIASANVASLLLVRTSSRYGEISLRSALGANRTRLVRQLLTENMILALPGGAIGFCLALWIIHATSAFTPAYLFNFQRPEIDLRVFAFVVAVSLMAALFSGCMPAVQFMKGDLLGGLQRTSGSAPWLLRLRGALVSAEVVLSLVLLIGAGLVTKSLLRLERESLGFSPHNLLLVETAAGETGTTTAEGNVQSYREIMDRLRHLPGVTTVGAINVVPLSGKGMDGGVLIEGRTVTDERSWPTAEWRLVSDDYFSAMQIPILRGRGILPEGREDNATVLINQTMARRYWPDGNPLGQRIAVPGLDGSTFAHYREGNNEWFTIVGITADVRQSDLAAPPDPEIYLPYFQHPTRARSMSMVMRTAVAPGSLLEVVKHEIRSLNPVATIRLVRYEDVLAQSIRIPRFRSYLIDSFALLAAILAAVGLYGLVGFSVAQRKQEIGIRMALGARSGQVVWFMLWQGYRLVLVGLGLGLIVASLLGRSIQGFLYNMSNTDPVTLGSATLLLAVVAAVACYIPARRASKVDPIVVLRYQ
jgi:putative ABC transport system permease protein